MTKIIFIDFDGTLYSHKQNRVPESAVNALNTIREKGIKIFLCTGRSLCELDDFDISMLKVDGLICNNGQAAYDEDKNIIYDYPCTGELKDTIVDVFNKKMFTVFIHTSTNVFCNYVSDFVVKVQSNINSPIPPVKAYENEDFYMCAIFNNYQDFDEFDKLNEIANITYWADGAVDVVPKTASKAMGIEKIINHYGFKKEETMGIGDSDNDIDMVEYCEIGIAMGNGYESVKKSADYVTDDIDNDGLYKAFKKFNII